MKNKLLACMLMLPSLSLADSLVVTYPTKDTNGNTLDPTSISHARVCLSKADPNVCDQEIDVAGSTAVDPGFKYARGKTVMVTGVESAWSKVFNVSEEVTEIIVIPNAPTQIIIRPSEG